MGSRHLLMFLTFMLGTCHVTSFSISKRHERSTDLADALAILQRQRRRAGGDYLGPDPYLNSPPLTLDDVSDWLTRSRYRGPRDDSYLDPAWVSDGDFKDFEPRLSYGPPYDSRPSVVPESVEPTKQELDEIFSSDQDESNSSKPTLLIEELPEKKKKEEMLEVKGDKKTIQKKSVGSELSDVIAAAAVASADEADEGLSLDSLTKEEFRTLMKAVGKLQKQVLKLSDKNAEQPEKVTIIESVEKEGNPKTLTIVEPASREELKSVFEEPFQPVIKETDVIVESPQGTKSERVVEETLVPSNTGDRGQDIKEAEKELSSAIASQLEADASDAGGAEREALNHDIEDEILANNIATLERYFLVNKYMKKIDGKTVPQKRTSKRSAGDLPVKGISMNDARDNQRRESDIIRNEIEDFSFDASPPPLSRFVAKILQLQDEVDRLKMVARLEDLENDVLTDALNEATLAQKEGSVSDMEFESLQQAIRIEEALQDLKNSDNLKTTDVGVIKRGEPWKRRRGFEVENEDGAILDDDELPAAMAIPRTSSDLVHLLYLNDLERLLGQQYLLKAQEEDEPESAIASLFIGNAEECPSVQEYSTNCELADLYSLPVDNEARSLCNIHEMCYACGNSLGVSQDHCDFVYRAAATALCQKKENCVLESEIFLRTMKLKTRYIPHAQPKCRSQCTVKFLGMI
ncbi:unnamed protein product [Lymnaea stagnalis]|uniref:Uncharacterized protein n=1 Tax=Lymnaea stagnalis TaxID=6523 RepID=A0AAV2I0V2_LYMST